MADDLQVSERIFSRYYNLIEESDFIKQKGRIIKVVGLLYESIGPNCSIGDKCTIESRRGNAKGYAEVVGFKDNKVLLMPLGELKGISPGSEVVTTRES